MKPELRNLARNLPREAGPLVEIRLLEAFRRRKAEQRKRWLIGVAAALVCMASGGYWLSQRAPVSVQAAEFVALPYAQSGVPLEQPVIVQVTAGRAELRAMGVSNALVNSRRIGEEEKVRADLLIGQDGVARAVRFVQ